MAFRTREAALAYCKKYQQDNAESIAARKKAQRAASSEKITEYSRAYHAKKGPERNASSRAWYAKNKTSVADRHAKWARENSHLTAARTRKRDAAKLNATPAWADFEVIKDFYAEAARLTLETGILHEVDHIVPLQGKNVCGLHVPCNLDVITKAANLSKGNRFE